MSLKRSKIKDRKLKTRSRAITVFLFVLLSACSSIRDGTVVGKEFDPAYQWTEMHPITDAKGTIRGYVPITHYEPDRYIIYLEKWEDGKKRTGSIYVTAHQYEEAKIGDYFPKRKEEF